MDDTIQISITKFETHINHTPNHVWYGILKREFWNKKYTLKGWFDVIETIKSRPAK